MEVKTLGKEENVKMIERGRESRLFVYFQWKNGNNHEEGLMRGEAFDSCFSYSIIVHMNKRLQYRQRIQFLFSSYSNFIEKYQSFSFFIF